MMMILITQNECESTIFVVYGNPDKYPQTGALIKAVSTHNKTGHNNTHYNNIHYNNTDHKNTDNDTIDH